QPRGHRGGSPLVQVAHPRDDHPRPLPLAGDLRRRVHRQGAAARARAARHRNALAVRGSHRRRRHVLARLRRRVLVGLAFEEVLASYSVSGNVQQGGGIDQYGASSAIMNFEIAAQGMGAKYVLDGTDYCAAMFNPEGDAGDVEMWELISPFVYLSRRVKASSAGPGRHRGGSSFESLFMVNKTAFWELQNIGTNRVL